MLNPDGTVSVTPSCTNALTFYLSNGTLTAAGLYAQVSPTNVSLGSADFAFGPDNPADIEGSFAAPGGILSWDNIAFDNGQAMFAFPTSGQGLVVAVFNGVLPDGYAEVELSVMASGGTAASSGLCFPYELGTFADGV